ncbi:MAG TPA: NAD-dependent epimerase/dehydratase family protein [Mycobacteriales bacterium]|nr:NAD-dependent epimerase/dehydratase family protein [Mycobacteriales bacterium]
MSETVLVTGATGLTGANVCQQLVARGDQVRALVRGASDAAPLTALGVEVVEGDITVYDDVLRAADGCDAAIHTAALLGGASQDINDFIAVNVHGTTHVLDAAEKIGMRRVVALSTSTFFDTSSGVPLDDAPLMEAPTDDPYTVTKLAAYNEVMERAARGQDIVSGHPGAIYGPSPVVSRALHRTSFNTLLLAGLRNRVGGYLRIPSVWVLGSDVARGSILALDKGVRGDRYILDGRPEDITTIAQACNQVCAIAGLPHHVEDIEPSDDPAVVERFGPTMIAIARKAARAGAKAAPPGPTRSERVLGYAPTSLTDGLTQTVDWFRAIGKL